MSVSCPNCSAANLDSALFCTSCGKPLASSTSPQQSEQQLAAPLPPYLAAYGVSAAPSRPLFPPPAAPSQPLYASPVAPSQPMYGTGAPASAGAPVAVATVPQVQVPAQVGANQGGVSFRRAFAGTGKLVMHQSWLLDGAGSHAISVRDSIIDLMRRRGILGTSVTPQRLTERGVLMEVRDYVQIHRGVSTVFTYVAPAGQDLYISRATTVQPAISRFRVIVMIFLAFVLLVGLASGASTASSLSSETGSGLLATPSLPSVPQLLAIGLTPLIIFFFVVFFIFSFVNWLVEKDFWVYLRPRSLNDFQLDDIALLEHATDGIVTDAVKQEGLDASKITPPAQGYQPKKKIRAV